MAYVDLASYDIVKIARDLGLVIKQSTSGSKEVPANCPFCPRGDKGYHLNLNRFINTFRCPKCGAEGGILHLIAAIKGCSRTEALELIKSGNGIYVPSENEIYQKKVMQTEYMQSKMNVRPVTERNAIYNAFLDMLTLSDRHKTDLIKRGLPLAVIQKNKYKSLPQIEGIRKNICYTLSKKYRLDGMPGFYTDKRGEWDFYSLSGYLIPVRDAMRNIQALQVRLDNEKARKYRFFSSTGYQNGTPTESYLHIVGKPSKKIIRLTEGPLKADIASYFSGEAYAAVPGVNSTKYLIPVLKQLNIKTVIDDFDMDKYTKEEVAKGVAKIRMNLQNEGIQVIEDRWDDRYKGIDDYLLYLYNYG